MAAGFCSRSKGKDIVGYSGLMEIGKILPVHGSISCLDSKSFLFLAQHQFLCEK